MLNTTRLLTITIGLLALGYAYAAAHSDDHNNQVIQATNLMLLSEEVASSTRPILLLISRNGCPHCTLLKNEILHPMLISGEYAEKIIIREIIINTGSMLIDFNGKKTNASNFANSYNIEVTPTLLFLGPKGEELVDRIVGINTIELFSYYVDQAIDQAILNFKSP